MKGYQGVLGPKLGDAPLHPQEIFKKILASKLGDAPVASLLRQQLSGLSPSAIFLLLHMLSAELGASDLGCLFLFAFNKLNPACLCGRDTHSTFS